MADSTLRTMLRPVALLRLALAIAASVGLWLAISSWIGDRTSIKIDWLPDTRDVDLLAPQWLLLASVVPAFYLLRVLSLTDLSLAQQLLQATLRSLVVIGVAVALARAPTWITETKQVSTVVPSWTSPTRCPTSSSTPRGATSSRSSRPRAHGNLQLITFAEKPKVVRSRSKTAAARAAHRAPRGRGRRHRHAGGDAELAYGLFPDGYLPRMVIVSDGNQTAGDLAVAGVPGQELNVSLVAHVRRGQGERGARGRRDRPRRAQGRPAVRGHGEVWSTEPQRAVLLAPAGRVRQRARAAQGRRAPRGQEPDRVQVGGQARRRDDVHAAARRATAQDTEKANNVAVMTAPVKGRPSVLYVEGSYARAGRGGLHEAGARAREHRRHGARPHGIRRRPRSSRSSIS